LENKCVCDIGEKGGDYGNRMYFIIVMENGWWIFMGFVYVWFYLEYEKRRENSSY
jgi:hypothetical protein